ncbi:MAG: flagellar export chaperone FliS [Acidobacteriota bacterium]|jgi:flagellar protein FliS|nr:flagellar export chaperone FliS [Acidobacteriota bacterium]
MLASYANAGTQYNQYRQQSAMTAAPGELTLMLYDGCIKDLKLARMYIEEKDLHLANENSKKAQAILDELMRTLDMQYPIAAQMMNLYEFIFGLVVQSNVKKDVGMIDTALELIIELRDAWQQAIRLNRQRAGAAASQV